MTTVATFSIVAFDPQTGELGVAVASKFIAAGAVVPWVQGGVGAVATQAWANTTYGPRAMKMMSDNCSPEQIIEALTTPDEGRNQRQLGVVDATGRVAAYTGPGCMPYAGHKTGKNYTVQGNILAGEEVLTAMAEAFEKAEGELAVRMIAAMAAGDAAGGDKRGRQSAALYIAREGWGYSGYNDRYRDLRVDDHDRPIDELKRIYEIHKTVFPHPPKAEE